MDKNAEVNHRFGMIFAVYAANKNPESAGQH
jgi:hypothetical protein